MLTFKRILGLTLLVIGCAQGAASAQLARLVKDLGRLSLSNTLPPELVGELGGRSLLARRQSFGLGELWSTDGTSKGTQLLFEGKIRDLSPGSGIVALSDGWVLPVREGDGQPFLLSTDATRSGTFAITDPSVVIPDPGLVALGEVVLFFGLGPARSPGLWGSDRSSRGARLLADIQPGRLPGPPVGLTRAGESVFFFSEGELWRSDGTATTTVRVAQLNHRRYRSASEFDDRLLFLVSESLTDSSLWISDGTLSGTVRLATIPGVNSPSYYLDLGDHALLSQWSLSGPNNLVWRTDGSAAGTSIVGLISARLDGLFALGDQLLSLESSESKLQAIDTRSGTKRTLLDCGALPVPCRRIIASSLLVAGGQLYFEIQMEDFSLELWRSDGTLVGTAPFYRSAPSTILIPRPRLLRTVGESILFAVPDRRNRLQVWRLGPNEGEATRLTNFVEALGLYRANFLSNGELLITASDSSGAQQLWQSTISGELRLLAIFREPAGTTPRDFLAIDERLYFIAQTYETFRFKLLPFLSQGDEATTHSLADIFPPVPESPRNAGEIFFSPATVNGLFLVERATATGDELWRTDGTSVGTFRLPTPAEFDGKDSPRTQLGDYLYLGLGAHLWRTDGSVDGTSLVWSAPASLDKPLIKTLEVADGRLYLGVVSRTGTPAQPTFLRQLWSSDGTELGTQLLTDSDTEFSLLTDLRAAGGRVYFSASDPVNGEELWSTDGTAAGTSLVADIQPGRFSSYPHLFSVLDDQLLFMATDTPNSVRWWHTDGTAAGTEPIFSFQSDNLYSSSIRFQGRIFFAAQDAGHGLELWASDGTSAGTTMVRDLAPGLRSSIPEEWAVTPLGLMFSADTGPYGRELWLTDGTTEGTRMVQDISPGIASANPRDLIMVGDRLYFSADDGWHGQELWSIDFSAVAGCRPSAHHLCLQEGRFQVELGWRDFQGQTGEGTSIPLTVDTGAFWFFDPDNLEAVVKVLDGRQLNDHFWTFFGALTNVEYALTVTDVESGLSRRYFNLPRRFASLGDTESFGPRGAKGAGAEQALAQLPAEMPGTAGQPLLVDHYFDPSALKAACAAGPLQLCLNDDRFAVTAEWEDFQGHVGVGTAVRLTQDTGYFWFFNEANIEVVLKVLDGRALNDHFWVFYGALSNVAYRLTVTDTTTGEVKIYENPLRHFASVGDTGAFVGN